MMDMSNQPPQALAVPDFVGNRHKLPYHSIAADFKVVCKLITTIHFNTD